MFSRLLRPLALTLATAWLLAATPALGDAVPLRVTGSTTLQPALERLIADYRDGQAAARVVLEGGGSGAGFSALLSGQADIAASSRFISAEERAIATERGVFPVPFRIAYDAIIPVVHKRNPVKDLSLEQLGRIFRGELRNWSELGGEDREIRVIAREPGSGTSQVWRERVEGGVGPYSGALRVASSAAVVREVANSRGAIGYIGLAYLNANVKPLRVGGVMGSLGNVRAGRYALARPLFLFTRGWPSGVALDFIDYVLDPRSGQRVIERSGLVALYPAERR